MIFFAVAGPTLGRLSRSFSEAVLRSTLPPAAAAGAFAALAGEAGLAGLAGEAAGAAAAPAPAVTSGVIFWIVLADTPALERSATEA